METHLKVKKTEITASDADAASEPKATTRTIPRARGVITSRKHSPTEIIAGASQGGKGAGTPSRGPAPPTPSNMHLAGARLPCMQNARKDSYFACSTRVWGENRQSDAARLRVLNAPVDAGPGGRWRPPAANSLLREDLRSWTSPPLLTPSGPAHKPAHSTSSRRGPPDVSPGCRLVRPDPTAAGRTGRGRRGESGRGTDLGPGRRCRAGNGRQPPRRRKPGGPSRLIPGYEILASWAAAAWASSTRPGRSGSIARARSR